MVSLDTGGLRSGASGEQFPGKHRLADVDSAVVDYIGFYHLMAVGLHKLGYAPAKKDVAYMAKVKRLVGVWR